MISQRHPIPQQRSVTRLRRLPIPILPDHILYSIKLRPAVIGVDNDLLPPDLALLLPVHQRLLLRLLLTLLFLCVWADYLILVRGRLLLFLGGVALLLLESNAVVVENYLLLRGSVVRRLYLGLASSLVLDLFFGTDRAWRRVRHSLHFSVVVLDLYLFEALVRNLALGLRYGRWGLLFLYLFLLLAFVIHHWFIGLEVLPNPSIYGLFP